MKKYKAIRIGKKTYIIANISPIMCKRIIMSLKGYKVEELKDIPEGMNVMVDSIAILLSGNGFFRLLKRFFIKRRLYRSSANEVIEGFNIVLESIPSNEFYSLNIILAQFNNLTAK